MKAIDFSSVQEAVSYITSKNDKGFAIFTTVEKVKEISALNFENVILCSTAGEYTAQGYKSGVVTGFEYDLNDVEIVEILYPPIKSLQNLKKAYQNVESNKNAFMLLLCDGLSGVEESILTTLYFVHDDFKIIGGSAGDNLEFKETLIYIGGRKVHSAALFFNSKNRTQIIKENIYVPTGKRLLITEADTINRTVKTFNNNPASMEYASILGINETELSKSFMSNPLGKIYKDDIFIASPMKINGDKSITFYCQLVANTFVQPLMPANPLEVLKNTISKAEFNPSFVFAINCILRSLKFQQEGFWKEFDKEMLSFCPNTAGFISYGEQYYKMHSNQTMVILLAE